MGLAWCGEGWRRFPALASGEAKKGRLNREWTRMDANFQCVTKNRKVTRRMNAVFGTTRWFKYLISVNSRPFAVFWLNGSKFGVKPGWIPHIPPNC
jgi:hypothetical protein